MSGPAGGDAALQALYATPPAAFTAARDALARELAAAGRAADAAAVKRRRRPTAAVWLLNALARERPRTLDALLAAGDALRRAQGEALRGRPGALRDAAARFHASVSEAADAVAALAAGLPQGASPAVATEVDRALRASATAPADERAALRSATLEALPGEADAFRGFEAIVPPAAPRGHAPAATARRDRGAAITRGPSAAPRPTRAPAASGGAAPTPEPAPDPRAAGARDRTRARQEAAARRAREQAERAAAAEARRRKSERAAAAREVGTLERRLEAAARELEDAQRAHEAARAALERARARLSAAERALAPGDRPA